MPLERMYIFPKALQKWWFRRRFRTVQDTYQLGGCAKFPRLPLRRGGSGGNSERYVQIPQRRLDKLGRSEPQPTRAACARRGAHGSLRATQEPVPAAKGSCGRAAQTAKAGARHCCCSAWRRAAEVGAEQTRLRGRNACTHSHLETRTVHITHPSTLESLALKKLERNCFRV